MTRCFGDRSRAALKGVHPKLVAVCERALQNGSEDFTVIEGLRTETRQRELYAQGRTKPGKIVTWTMASKHRAQPDGYGHAVDLVTITGKAIDWSSCERIAPAMMKAAKDLGVKIRWGGNWDGDERPKEKGETDGPHFELMP